MIEKEGVIERRGGWGAKEKGSRTKKTRCEKCCFWDKGEQENMMDRLSPYHKEESGVSRTKRRLQGHEWIHSIWSWLDFAKVVRVDFSRKCYFNTKHARLAGSRGTKRYVICLLAFPLCSSEGWFFLEAVPLGYHNEYLSYLYSLYNTRAYALKVQLAIRSSIQPKLVWSDIWTRLAMFYLHLGERLQCILTAYPGKVSWAHELLVPQHTVHTSVSSQCGAAPRRKTCHRQL